MPPALRLHVSRAAPLSVRERIRLFCALRQQGPGARGRRRGASVSFCFQFPVRVFRCFVVSLFRFCLGVRTPFCRPRTAPSIAPFMGVYVTSLCSLQSARRQPSMCVFLTLSRSHALTLRLRTRAAAQPHRQRIGMWPFWLSWSPWSPCSPYLAARSPRPTTLHCLYHWLHSAVIARPRSLPRTSASSTRAACSLPCGCCTCKTED